MRYLIYLILVVSTSLQAGTIQKWVDENGNVHYGDAPPVSTKTESVSVQSAPSNPGKALPRLSTEQADDAAGASGDDSSTAGNDSDDEAQSICASARGDLEIIRTNRNIRLEEADGTTRKLSAVEIEERRAAAQSRVDRYCN